MKGKNTGYHMEDTIAAIATAPGGGIGIIRVSGECAVDVLGRIFRGKNRGKINKSSTLHFESHKMYYGEVVDDVGDIIDEVMAVIMYAPKSYTREDVAEIHCHGGLNALGKVMEAVLRSGARLAEPGEFTKRAFLNGRIDLTQAEAVSEILAAKSDAQHKAAVERLGGGLSVVVGRFKDKILDCLSIIEALIDYPEYEEDIDDGNAFTENIGKKISEIIEGAEYLVKSAEAGKILTEGINTVIVGKPNVGKSSLLNMLLMEERAIVTGIAGTTRDTLTEYMRLPSGIMLKLTDTAGLRESGGDEGCEVELGEVEKIGIAKARESVRDAELILAVFDGSDTLSKEDMEVIRTVVESKRNFIYVVNKNDLRRKLDLSAVDSKFEGNFVEVSAKNKVGIEELEKKISEKFGLIYGETGRDENYGLLANVRHRDLMSKTVKSLKMARDTARDGLPIDFISIDLQTALGFLCDITGDNASDELVEDIFSRFCLGK